MDSPHAPAPTSRWQCRRCGTFRDVECEHTGPGVPACQTCQQPMELMDKRAAPQPIAHPVELQWNGPLLDPDTIMEPEDDIE